MLIHCPHCIARVDAVIKGQVQAWDSEYACVRVSLLECPACQKAVVARDESVQQGDFGATDEWSTPMRVWPEPDSDTDGPLFRTTGRSTGTPHRLTQQDAYRLIQRYASRAGITTRIGNHSMRATALTDYLKNGGSLAEARKMANHADTRTTQLYDRRADVASLDEYWKVGI